MAISSGTENYNCDVGAVRARGCSLSKGELAEALRTDVNKILSDYKGKAQLKEMLQDLATTGFQNDNLNAMIDIQPEEYDWRVGEGIAEAYLSSHRACEYPWPGGRDLKNPTASAAGTDLVGLQKMVQDGDCRFAFGEVKTSNDPKYPPSLMYGRSGLKQQMEVLRDDVNVRHALVKYLGLHAVRAQWQELYKGAAKRYLSNPSDVSILGVMVRDVAPDPDDLRARAKNLASNCPKHTAVELLAVYLPSGSIAQLPQLVNSGGEQ